MDWDGDVSAVYPASHFESEMDIRFEKGTLFCIPHLSVGACPAVFSVDGGIDCQRDDSVKLYIFFSADSRLEFFCETNPYDLFLLGICSDEPALGTALEYYAAHDTAASNETMQSVWLADGILWQLCVF